MRHGGQILTRALELHCVDRVFTVPGESFLAALDGLHDSAIETITCRHEGGVAMMAEATGKLTGRPGVGFVTRGPGATNAACGLHIAQQDSTPMVLFVGQIARGHRDREAFQELNYRAVFGPMVKWAAEVDQTERLPEYVMRAFHVAQSGRPGPVVLALPEDMLSARAEVADLGPTASAIAVPDPAALAEIDARLAQAARPMIVVGGPLWSQDAAEALDRYARARGLPVATAFRRQAHLDNRSPAYAGDLNVAPNPKLRARLAQADVVLALGTRLGDITTHSYTALDPQAPGPEILHIHPDADTLGRVHRTTRALPARPDLAALALAARPGTGPDRASQAHEDYADWRAPQDDPGALTLAHVVRWLSDTLPDDAIITNGAGNYAAWLHRHFQFKRYGTQLAPTSGSMGYGLPAAIAAKLAHPDRTVIAFAGDGCFQMTLQELSTATQHDAQVIAIVAENGRYGTIRAHQERQYPGRTEGTDLSAPDFAALAQAYGAHGETVTENAGFAPAFARAVESGKPAVIALKLDPDALAPGKRLSQTR